MTRRDKITAREMQLMLAKLDLGRTTPKPRKRP